MLSELELTSYLHRKDPGATADVLLQSVQCALEQGWSKRIIGFSVVLQKR